MSKTVSTKTTKYYDLFSALKSGENVSPASLCSSLGFSSAGLAVYLHALRNKFGAKIESIRASQGKGRTVIAYRLINIAECEKNIPPHRKPRTTKAKATAMHKVTKTVKAKAPRKAKAPSKAKAPRKAKKARDRSLSDNPDDMSVVEITNDDLAEIRQSLGI